MQASRTRHCTDQNGGALMEEQQQHDIVDAVCREAPGMRPLVHDIVYSALHALKIATPAAISSASASSTVPPLRMAAMAPPVLPEHAIGGILCGPPGAGKTMLAHALKSNLPLRWHRTLHAADAYGRSLGHAEAVISLLLAEAAMCRPALLVIEDVDVIASAGGGGGVSRARASQGSVEARAGAQLMSQLSAALPADGGVFVLGLTNRPDALHPELIAPGRLEHVWTVPVPDRASRRQMLALHLQRIQVGAGAGQTLAASIGAAWGENKGQVGGDKGQVGGDKRCCGCDEGKGEGGDDGVGVRDGDRGGVHRDGGSADAHTDATDTGNGTTGTESLLDWLSQATGGFVAADLAALCRTACTVCLSSTPDAQPTAVAVQRSHFAIALERAAPSLLHVRADGGDLHANELDNVDTGADATALTGGHGADPFNALHGMDGAIAQLRSALLLPIERPDAFATMGEQPPRGVLVTGPPGTGKTALARAAGQALRVHGHAHFLPVVCSELVSKLVGQTERALSSLFARARAVAPCVVFLDQLETLAPVRGHDTSTQRTFDRVLSTLLTELEGVTSAGNGAGVSVLAATVDPKWLDPAVLRPGRFDVHIRLLLPDTAQRSAIIGARLQRTRLQVPAGVDADEFRHALARDVAALTQGCSGATLCSLCDEAAMNALREHIDVGHAGDRPPADDADAGVFVQRRHFEHALAQLQETTVGPKGL